MLHCVQWVLIRIFGGDDSLFARRDEIRIFAAVAHAGLGPRLLVSLHGYVAQADPMCICQTSPQGGGLLIISRPLGSNCNIS